MIKPSEDVLRAIVSLQNSNPVAWDKFMGWFTISHMGHLAVSVRIKDEVEARWMDGRCQELADQIEFLQSAEQIIKNIQAAEEVPSTSAILD